MSSADRAYLDRHQVYSFGMPTAIGPVWPVLATAIRSAQLAEAEAEAAEAAKAEATIVAVLGKPDDEWIQPHPSCGWELQIPGIHYMSAGARDERIVARVAALRPELERRRSERDAQLQIDKAKRIAAAEAKEATRKAARESLRQWALASHDPALARAAKDGYDVADAIVGCVAQALADEVCGEVSKEGTAHWDRWDYEDRCAPSAEAFAAYDHTKQAIEALDKPAGVNVTLQRIARVTVDAIEDEDGEDGEDDIYTAIVIMLDAPSTGCKDRAVIVRVDK
jgi:hypothetical protein